MRTEMAAGIIVYWDGAERREYLFLKRKEGWLDLPKGHIEGDEDEHAAAKRETLEETGLEVHPHEFFRYAEEYKFTRGKEEVHKKNVFFIGRVDGAKSVKISHEHVGFEWLTFGQALKELSFENQKTLLKEADKYIGRLDALHSVNKEYAKLPAEQKEWGLSRTFVPGEGPVTAEIMFLGQAPGRNEDEQRRPFIGKAGQLLDQMIHRAGLKRKDVYITSIVQFFPPENRLPTEEEAALCMPFLERQIKLIKPKLLVLLGSFSATNIAGIGTVMKTHGTFKHLPKYDCDVFVTLHPAAAVRIKANVPTIEKDFDKLRDILKPEKQKTL